jgi:hypothetical protein
MVDLITHPLDENQFQPTNQPTNEISGLARYGSKQVKKEALLPAFKAAFKKEVTKENICASFRDVGLVPNDPEVVLSKLDVVLRTPAPPKPEDTPWEFKTPSNLLEIEAQSTLIRERIRLHRDSPVSPLLRVVVSIGHETVLMRQEIAELRKAVEVANKVRGRNRNYIRASRILTIGGIAKLIANGTVVARRG